MADELTNEEVGAVNMFGRDMIARLEQHVCKGGWHGESEEGLFTRLIEEVGELAEAVREGPSSAVANEAVDVANFAMMMVDLLRRDGLVP